MHPYDPDDLPVGHCGHGECNPTEGCHRVSSRHAQQSMWCCPVSLCRRPMLTIDHPAGRRSYEVLNADRLLAGIDRHPILAPHWCRGFSRN